MTRTSSRAYRRNRKRCLASSDTCWLCGQWIDPDIAWPDPMSATADHVIPVSKGGDNLGELRPAHLRCNVRRSRCKPPTVHARRW